MEQDHRGLINAIAAEGYAGHKAPLPPPQLSAARSKCQSEKEPSLAVASPLPSAPFPQQAEKEMNH